MNKLQSAKSVLKATLFQKNANVGLGAKNLPKKESSLTPTKSYACHYHSSTDLISCFQLLLQMFTVARGMLADFKDRTTMRE